MQDVISVDGRGRFLSTYDSGG